MGTIEAVALGFLLDLILGDPPFLYHPVRAIGWLIEKGEIFLRESLRIPVLEKAELEKEDQKQRHKKEKKAGALLVVLVLVVTFIVTYGIIFLANFLHAGIGFIVKVLLSYQILATKSLKVESMKVYHALTKQSIEQARVQLSFIVGRDTKNLEEEGIVKATVETVAENTSDGVIAPLFFLAVGGPVLGMLYKAVNTMDSMIAYQNERYLYFGRAAAKLDDLVNFIPARLSAYVMLLASFLLGYDAKEAYRIYKRDQCNHKSPNSAHTEAVCAGALGIRLGGDAYYFGKKVKKPTIGEEKRKAQKEDIKRANQLMYGTSFLSFLIILMIWIGIKLYC